MRAVDVTHLHQPQRGAQDHRGDPYCERRRRRVGESLRGEVHRSTRVAAGRGAAVVRSRTPPARTPITSAAHLGELLAHAHHIVRVSRESLRA